MLPPMSFASSRRFARSSAVCVLVRASVSDLARPSRAVSSLSCCCAICSRFSSFASARVSADRYETCPRSAVSFHGRRWRVLMRHSDSHRPAHHEKRVRHRPVRRGISELRSSRLLPLPAARAEAFRRWSQHGANTDWWVTRHRDTPRDRDASWRWGGKHGDPPKAADPMIRPMLRRSRRRKPWSPLAGGFISWTSTQRSGQRFWTDPLLNPSCAVLHRRNTCLRLMISAPP
jgi:hypothetical protein